MSNVEPLQLRQRFHRIGPIRVEWGERGAARPNPTQDCETGSERTQNPKNAAKNRF